MNKKEIENKKRMLRDFSEQGQGQRVFFEEDLELIRDILQELEQKESILSKVTDKLKEDRLIFNYLVKEKSNVIVNKSLFNHTNEILNIIEGEKIMPTEEYKLGKVYFKAIDDDEYKELNFTDVEETLENDEEPKIKQRSYEAEGEVEITIETKRYTRKRFKKLLMSRGVQRNTAEVYSRYFNRTQLELDLFF